MHDLVRIQPRLQRGDGRAEIVFAADDGRTRLAHLHQQAPLRVLFPRSEPDDLPTAALLMTAGGIAGGDRLAVVATVERGARAAVVGQAAEKVYRAVGEEAAQASVELRVADEAWLEWMPQDTILFDRARLRRRFEIDIAEGGRLLACDSVVFGRTASGERFVDGLWHDRWQVRRGGRLVWADALRVEKLATIDDPAGFDGASAYATALYVGPDAPQLIELARSLATGCARAGATVVGGVLLARFLDREASAVRLALANYVARFRAAVAGLPATAPRLWQC